MQYLYTESEVRKMWERPKEEQYQVAQAKCIEAIVRTDGELALSFSGGKDSAVLLFIMAQMWNITIKKRKKLIVAFADTTNEFICARKYRKDYIAWIENKFDIEIDYIEERADTNYIEVIDKVGLPFISKTVARMTRDCKKTLKRLGMKYADIKEYMPKHYSAAHIDEMIQAADKLRELGFNDTVVLNLTKIRSDNKIGTRFLPVSYRPILDNPNIELSEECCGILKKGVAKKVNKRLGNLLPVTGEMAEESRERLEAYRKTGCNMLIGEHRKSKPMGAMTEQTVLWIIKEFEIPIMPVYGQCECNECGKYKLSGEQRTGCKLCGFGLMFDNDRFIRLAEIEPNVVRFAFTSKKNGGLGYGEICDFLNKECGMNIGIPQIEQGYYPKRIKGE